MDLPILTIGARELRPLDLATLNIATREELVDSYRDAQGKHRPQLYVTYAAAAIGYPSLRVRAAITDAPAGDMAHFGRLVFNELTARKKHDRVAIIEAGSAVIGAVADMLAPTKNEVDEHLGNSDEEQGSTSTTSTSP